MVKTRKAQSYEPAAVWAPIESIHPWDDNPRHNDDAVASVARSIEAFGFASPIVARKANNEIIAGHTRYWAARQIGLPNVPVRFLDVDASQARTLALADNRLGEIATWDDDKLRELLRDSAPDEAYLAGWSDGELAALLDDHQIDVEPFNETTDSQPPPSNETSEHARIEPSDDESDISDDPAIANDNPHAQAPFPWFGGKSRAANAVWRHLGNVQHYIEPFCGSAAVLLRRPEDQIKPANRETVNDADGLICNFWRALATEPELVAHHADWPISEADLAARQIACIEWRRSNPLGRLSANPDYYDPKIAGWWVWGQSCSIAGWCSDKGPWTVRDGELVKASGDDTAPRISRQRPNITAMGTIFKSNIATSRAANKTPFYAPEIEPWFTWLANRMRHVNIIHGDWSRVTTHGAMYVDTVRLRESSVCGVFIDPPYSGDVRAKNIYAIDDHTIAADVRKWCAENGSDPKVRIVLAGFAGEGHEELTALGWRERKWFVDGGFSVPTKNQRHRDRLWLSPHCLD